MRERRRFLEADDGRKLFMLTVIRMSDSDVVDPVTGKMGAAREIMMVYTPLSMPALFARAGNIASAGRNFTK